MSIPRPEIGDDIWDNGLHGEIISFFDEFGVATEIPEDAVSLVAKWDNGMWGAMLVADLVKQIHSRIN